MKEDEIVSHGDAGPWNVVYRDGLPVAFIDWDGARPARPIDDLASVAWHFISLGPDDFLRAAGFSEPFRTGERLRILCDAYGLTDRIALLAALARVRQLGAEKLRYWQPLPPAIAARHLRAAVRDLEWLSDATDRPRAHLQ